MNNLTDLIYIYLKNTEIIYETNKKLTEVTSYLLKDFKDKTYNEVNKEVKNYYLQLIERELK